ncbi:MAG: hypothetical protein ABIS50_19810 [Luteolibacter sp.]|uniref:tetratricopeptide repeat protein n=1 Tax=Luteolibacter sp. TaxID=1962973 RepID=UPI003266933F
MKATFLLTLFVLSSPLMAQDKPAAIEKMPVTGKGEAAPPDLMPNQKAFLNLPEESRNAFLKGLGEATRLFQQKRVFETLEELDKVAKIFEDSPEVYNIRGSCFVEMRAFDKALVEFKKADALAKDNPSIEFNIAEVYFCTKEWKKSLDLLLKILKETGDQNMALSRLVEFKILLCEKKLGMNDEAKKLGDKYDFQDDSPFYYYAQAALAYEDNNLVKAEEWLAMAGRVFQDANVLAPWQDTMVEYGYIKSFYGEDAAAEK